MTSDSRQRIALAYQLVWSRPARPIELERGIWYIDEYKKQLAKAGVPQDLIEAETWTSFARIMLSANEFVYID